MTRQEDMLRQYEMESMAAQQQQQQLQNAQSQSQAYATSMFGNQQKQNLVEYELDFTQELVDIERLLRCDVLERDKEGNESWIPNPDKDNIFLNALGVNDVLRKIRLLINKNKVLSNYSEGEIMIRTRMIINEIRVLIYNNYEQYGIDNEYKMNNYSIIVLALGSTIEDTYRRALNGETHKALAEQRLVTQTQGLTPQAPYYPQLNNKPHGLAKILPWNWISK